MIVGEKFQEFVYLLFREASDVIAIIDITGRRSNHNEALKHVRRLERS
jgi:hypothetical protein